MIAIAKKNPLRKRYNFKTTHMTVNQRMYGWADSLFFNELISGSVLHTLKAIITTRHMKQPTIQQINDARTRSSSTKFAQSDSVDNRTIRRHVKKLETLKLINVYRMSDQWKSRNAYSICVPDELLVKQHEDIVSSSISCSSSLSERRRRTTNKKQNKQSVQHTATAASTPQPDGSAFAAAPGDTKHWQDELREEYERKAEITLTAEEIRANAKAQFRAFKQILGKRR